MADETRYSETEAHQKFAKDLFNLTWTLLEKSNRTPEEDDTMVHCAHASRYHWGNVGKPEHLTVGEWQIARVYSVLGRGAEARHHAQRALDICQKNQIGDFYLASAYEGLARAAKVQGRTDEMRQYLELARKACADVKDNDDREIVEKDIESLH